MADPAKYTFVHPLLRFRRERALAVEGEVVGQRGKTVTSVQVVVRAPSESDFHLVDASKMLGVPPEKVGELMVVDPGAPVEQGMPLAKRKQLIGSKEVISPVDGVLRGVKNGRLVMQQTTQWQELRAGINGRIVNHLGNRGVLLEINGALIQTNWSNGKEGSGILRVVAESPEQSFAVSQIDGDVMGHILVAGRADQADALESISNIGLRGLVVGSLPNHLLPLVRQFSFPVYLTECIGLAAMSAPIFQMLNEFNGREASLFCKGRPRPELIVVRETPASQEEQALIKSLKVGQMVRILRFPSIGQVGQISRLYTHTAITTSGIKAHGADVILSDGTTIFVPYNNLDCIIQD